MGSPFPIGPQSGPINPKTKQPWSKEPIDDKASTFWALAQLSGVGAFSASVTTYDLANRETGRGHRMRVYSVGPGLSLPVTGSFTSSDYIYFRTRRPVNFDDFDYCGAQQAAINAIVYTRSNLIIWEGAMMVGDKLLDLNTSGFGLSLPSIGIEHGTTSVLYGNGMPVDPVIPEIVFDQPPGPEQLDHRIRISQKDESLVIEIKGDALFDTDDSKIRPDAKTILKQAGQVIKANRGRIVKIEGHTDNTFRGSKHDSQRYNLNLSEQRALAVALWLDSEKYAPISNTKTEGFAFSQPKMSNDTEAGRQTNRRVEIILAKRPAGS